MYDFDHEKNLHAQCTTIPDCPKCPQNLSQQPDVQKNYKTDLISRIDAPIIWIVVLCQVCQYPMPPKSK